MEIFDPRHPNNRPRKRRPNRRRTIGEAIRSERMARRLTQAEAARNVGLTRAVWGKYERDDWPASKRLVDTLTLAGWDLSYKPRRWTWKKNSV